jgi:serine protease AprX
VRPRAAWLLPVLVVPLLLAPVPASSTWEARSSPAFDADRNGLFDALDQEVARAAPSQPLDVIVLFDGDVGPGVDAVRRAVPGAEVRSTVTVVPAAALRLPARDVPALAGLREVVQVEPDPVGQPELVTSTHYLGARHVWNTLGVTGDADGDPSVFTKDDATIAVLDTGIHAQHLDFQGKLLAWHDTVSGSPVPSDGNGHGTHVASIAAGRGLASAEHQGVAPGASLVMVRISQKSHALEAVQWVIDHRAQYGIDVMTMSFGFGIGADGSDSLAQAFDRAFEAGVVTVKSTGNSGPNLGTMTIPADARHILAVGAVADPGKGGWNLATFSSRGPTTDGRVKPDISAPGVSISAARTGTTNGYTSLSGTSMAAPHLAGVAALVKAANPALDASDIRRILVETAQERGRPGPDNDYGAGLVDPTAAVHRAMGSQGSNPIASPSVISRGDTFSGTDTWVFDLAEGSHPIALTFLTDAPPGNARRYTLVLAGPSDNLAAYVEPSTSASRHVNLGLAGPDPGLYVLQVVAPPGAVYTIDASGGWSSSPIQALHVPPV